MNDTTKNVELILYLDVRRQIREKAFAGARAPPRRAVRPAQLRDAYWRGKDCYGWVGRSAQGRKQAAV
jgi:hypothetical protein